MNQTWQALQWAPIAPAWAVAAAGGLLAVAAVIGAWRSPGAGPWAALPVRLVVVAALVLLALRPTIPGQDERAAWSATDVYFVVDTTASMGAIDGDDDGQTRLTAAQIDAIALLDGWAAQGSRAAVVAFQREPRVVAPLTTDSSAVARAIAALEPEPVRGSAGSVTGVAGPLLVELIEAQAALHPDRSALIVYLGDGENTAAGLGDLTAAGDAAQGAAVLGYGTEDGARMRATTLAAASIDSFVVDPATGGPAISRMDPDGLARIAAELDGTATLRSNGPLPTIERPALREYRIDDARVPAGTEDLAWRLGWVVALALLVDLALTGVGFARSGLPRRRA